MSEGAPEKPEESFEAAWYRVCLALDIASASLMRASPFNRGHRGYFYAARVYKLSLSHWNAPADRRTQTPAGEFSVLERGRGIAGIVQPLDSVRQTDFVALVLQRAPGIPMSQAKRHGLRALVPLLRLAYILCRLSTRGISHNDLWPENVLFQQGGQVYVLDFDQATFEPPVTALLGNFIGTRTSMPHVKGAYVTSIREVLARKMLADLQRWMGRLKASLTWASQRLRHPRRCR